MKIALQVSQDPSFKRNRSTLMHNFKIWQRETEEKKTEALINYGKPDKPSQDYPVIENNSHFDVRRCCRTVETPPWQQVTIGYNTVSSRQKTTALHASGGKSESRGYYTILSKLSLWAPLSSPQMLKTNEILEAFIVALKWMISAPCYILYSI